MIEFVDHLHEHFIEPVVIERGAYRAPRRPGAGTEMQGSSLLQYRWRGHHDVSKVG